MSTFDVKQPALSEILKDIGNGSIQLPDFQREWVWDDHHIRSLIASVSQAFPIGVVLALEARNTNIRLKTRFLEGVDSRFADKEQLETLRMIRDHAPSVYLQKIEEEVRMDDAEMDKRLAAHLISADALRADDFWGFFEARKKDLLDVIEKAMGKVKP